MEINIPRFINVKDKNYSNIHYLNLDKVVSFNENAETKTVSVVISSDEWYILPWEDWQKLKSTIRIY